LRNREFIRSCIIDLDAEELRGEGDELFWKYIKEPLQNLYLFFAQKNQNSLLIVYQSSFWKYGNYRLEDLIASLLTQTHDLNDFILRINSCRLELFPVDSIIVSFVKTIMPPLEPLARNIVTVEFVDEKVEFKFHPMELDLIEDEPIRLVGCMGTMREGKSTLMNLFIRYRFNQNSLENSDSLVEFFSTSNGHETHTIGMMGCLIPDQQNGWILLIDFEGFEDPHKDDAYDQYLFTLAISTVGTIIFNQRGSGIKAPTLDFLASMCENTKYMLSSSSESTITPKSDLLVLFRDFTLSRSDATAYHEKIIQESPVKKQTLISSINVFFCSPPPQCEKVGLATFAANCAFRNDIQVFFSKMLATTEKQQPKTIVIAEMMIRKVCQIMSDNLEKGDRLLHSHLEGICMTKLRSLGKQFDETLWEVTTDELLRDKMDRKQSELLDRFRKGVIDSIPDYPDTLLRNSIARSKLQKINENKYRATELAKKLRERVEACKPPQNEYLYPNGTIDAFDYWVLASIVLMKRHFRGPVSVIESTIHDFKVDQSSPRNFINKYNLEQTKRAKKEKKRRENRIQFALEEQKRLNSFYRSTNHDQGNVKHEIQELQFQISMASKKLDQQKERQREKEKDLEEMVQDYESRLIQIQQEGRERMELRLEQKDNQYKNQIDTLNEKIQELEHLIEIGKKKAKSVNGCKMQ
jgi:hypothetical protein